MVHSFVFFLKLSFLVNTKSTNGAVLVPTRSFPTLFQFRGRGVTELQRVVATFDRLLRVEGIRVWGGILVVLREHLDVVLGQASAMSCSGDVQVRGVVNNDGLLHETTTQSEEGMIPCMGI